MVTNINSKIVVDASVILAQLLPDEKNTSEIEIYFTDFSEYKLDFVAPLILKYEVSNTLKNLSSRRKLTIHKRKALLKEFLLWPITYKEIDFNSTFELAIKNDLTVYDASYLYLAKSNNWQLLTLDKKLASL